MNLITFNHLFTNKKPPSWALMHVPLGWLKLSSSETYELQACHEHVKSKLGAKVQCEEHHSVPGQNEHSVCSVSCQLSLEA